MTEQTLIIAILVALVILWITEKACTAPAAF